MSIFKKPAAFCCCLLIYSALFLLTAANWALIALKRPLRGPKDTESCTRWSAQWRHLTNTRWLICTATDMRPFAIITVGTYYYTISLYAIYYNYCFILFNMRRHWCSYLSEARCTLFAWSSWCHCIPKTHCLLPHLNSDWFCLSGTGLPRLSWKRGR